MKLNITNLNGMTYKGMIDMNFYEFGQENDEIIVMIHGLTMTWDMFQKVIDQLKEEYHVIAVAVPGHDLTNQSDFTTVEEVSTMIENYLLSKNYHNILCLYGLSMGGGIAIRILANHRVHFENAIIDAGITPYEMPYLFTRFILLNDFCTTMLARQFPSLLNLVFPADRFDEDIRRKEIIGIRHMTAKTIWNAYDSTDNYSMPKVFPDISTNIEYWYGEDEKKDRKLDIQYVEKHIPNVTFQMIPNMTHGQFVCSEPERFCQKLKEVVNQK